MTTSKFTHGEAEHLHPQKADSLNCFANSLHSGQGWSPLDSPGGTIEVLNLTERLSVNKNQMTKEIYAF